MRWVCAGERRDHARVLPDPAPAALRVRAGQPRQSRGAQCRGRHHRSGDGQSRSAGAAPRRRQAQGDGRQAAHGSLFRFPRHPRPAPRPGGVLRSVPSDPTPSFFEALERAVIHSIPKPIAVVVCYPANPTAYVASLEFYRDLVAFAKKHGLFVLSDLAYAEVYFDDHPPPSVLQVPGAIDVTVEFTSLSKTYSMPGWRMGFAVGNERIISALARVKSYLDYGAFTPIQVAAAAALNGPDDCIHEMRETYKRRRDVLVESFGRAGWEVPPPRASMFAWAPIPEPFQTIGSIEFSTLLVEKASVAVSPGIGFGEHGEGYVRIALVENEQRIRQAARNVRRFLETGVEKLHNVVPLATRR